MMDQNEQYFKIYPVGVIKKVDDERDCIEVFPPYVVALDHLGDGFTHIIVLWWAHQNDTPEARSVLKGKPPNHPAPVMGVFATRSPYRPNPILMTVVRLLSLEENKIYVKKFEAFDQTPVIDVKPYLPNSDCFINARVPTYFEKISKPRTD